MATEEERQALVRLRHGVDGGRGFHLEDLRIVIAMAERVERAEKTAAKVERDTIERCAHLCEGSMEGDALAQEIRSLADT